MRSLRLNFLPLSGAISFLLGKLLMKEKFTYWWTPTHDIQEHWTAVSTLFGLISSVDRNQHNWRSNQRPQIAVTKLYCILVYKSNSFDGWTLLYCHKIMELIFF